MAHWPRIKLGYDSDDNLVYRGLHANMNASTSDGNWMIFKYAYDSSDNITDIKGPVKGSWEDREKLF